MTGVFVRSDVQNFLAMMAANPRPAFTAEFLAQIRNLPPGVMASLDLPVGDLAVIRDVMMPSPAGDIALRLFDARAARDPGPVVVFYHGGGFVVGSIDIHAAVAAEIARGLDLPVISVEYRLAPENPFPAAPDDAEAAARWIAENGAAFGREFTSLIPCGDSAGGTLAIVTTMALRDRPAVLPVSMQILFYPGTDLAGQYPSTAQFGSGYGLDATDTVLYRQHYNAPAEHWRGSPLHGNHAAMPPTLVVTAGLDPLRDQGRAYAAKLIEAGSPTTYRDIPGIIHGFATYRQVIPSAQADLTAILSLARALIGGA
jgi:acetyl esterase